MAWIPDHPMNPCPNPACEKPRPPHVDFYQQGSSLVSGCCPYCGVKGPCGTREGSLETRVQAAVGSWNVVFPDRHPLTPELVTAAVERQLVTIQDSTLVTKIRAHLVTPYCVDRPWDYGAVGDTYPCWTVMEQGPRALVYCLEGFGPKMPWGLVWADPACSMGMDSSWFSSLETICAQEFFDEVPS